MTLFLVASLMALIANLLFEAHKVLRYQEYRNQSNQAALLGINRICCEAREAAYIEQVGLNVLQLIKIDPTQNRFDPQAAPTDPPSSNDRYRHLLRVRYRITGTGLLIRETGPASGGFTEVQTVVEGVVGLTTANSTATSTLQVVLTTADQNNQLKKTTSEVFLMGVAP